MKTEDDLKIINFIKKNPDFVKRNRAYFSGLLNDLNNSKKINILLLNCGGIIFVSIASFDFLK